MFTGTLYSAWESLNIVWRPFARVLNAVKRSAYGRVEGGRCRQYDIVWGEGQGGGMSYYQGRGKRERAKIRL